VSWQNIVLGVEANVYGGITFDQGRHNAGAPGSSTPTRPSGL